MPTLYREAKWKLTVYADEHGEPHFHIESPGGRCSVSIERLEVIIGKVNRRVLKAALAWAAQHRPEIRKKWLELNP
jgi:hypothetical protein